MLFLTMSQKFGCCTILNIAELNQMVYFYKDGLLVSKAVYYSYC